MCCTHSFWRAIAGINGLAGLGRDGWEWSWELDAGSACRPLWGGAPIAMSKVSEWTVPKTIKVRIGYSLVIY